MRLYFVAVDFLRAHLSAEAKHKLTALMEDLSFNFSFHCDEVSRDQAFQPIKSLQQWQSWMNYDR